MDASRHFPALADSTRRAIFEQLVRRPQSVAELASNFPVSRPAVSQHLRVLQDAGLVRFERSGTRSIYECDRAGLDALRRYLEGLWSEALQSLKNVAEDQYRANKQRKEQQR